MSSKGSFYWHDYETFGADPKRDRPAQFAGIRTDFDFNEIDKPLEIFCKPADDFLPHPKACLITGITPQIADEKGVVEAEFIKRIHQEFAKPNTCVVGYNSLRFDDEVTRNTLYRNFFDPYAREWQNGNSRWDIIDMMRLTRALRPEGIHWPNHADGKPSFKLEELTVANGISHANAHDAVSDVRATIAMARLIKLKQPRLFDYVFANRDKRKLQAELNPGLAQPLIHVSGMFPAERGCIAIVLPIAWHPTNKNAVAVYDLSHSPEDLINLDIEELQERIFTKAADLTEGKERVPLKQIHVNRCPIVVPLKTLRPQDAERLGINVELCLQHASVLADHLLSIGPKVAAVFNRSYEDTVEDPDLMLYSGGFFSSRDKAIMEQIRETGNGGLAALSPMFEDERLPTMWLRYRARNYPETLTSAERAQWEDYRQRRFEGLDPAYVMSKEHYKAEIQAIEASGTINDKDAQILQDLKSYENQLVMPFDGVVVEG